MSSQRQTARALSLSFLLAISGVAAAANPGDGLQTQGLQATAELPEEVTLAAVVALLRDQSPRSRAEQARIAVAEGERLGAGVWQNPSLSYGGVALAQGTNTGSAWQHQFTLEQPLLIFGQTSARSSAAELGVRAERAQVAADLGERALAARQGFYTLVARQERVKALQESLTELQGLEKIVRGRQAAGDRSVYDVTRLALETSTLDTELSIARTEVADASGRLAAVLGFPGWHPRAQGELGARELPTDFDQLWSVAQRQRPSIAAAQAAESRARAGLTVARRDWLPVPSLALGTLVTRDANSVAVTFGASVPLPVFDHGQGPVARASADIDLQSRRVAAELAETRAELERARAVYLAERDTVAKIEHDQVAQIPVLERMAQQSYQGGGTSVLELLDAFRSVKEIRVTYLERQEALKLAEETLIASAGLEPLLTVDSKK